MKTKIFKHMVSLTLFILALSLVVSMHVLYQHMSQLRIEDWKTEVTILAATVRETKGKILEKFTEQTGRQIVWFSHTGEVLFAADDLDGKEMFNQPEVQEAWKTGEGSGTHPMKNAFQQMFNYAVSLEDGSILYVSRVHDTLLFGGVELFWSVLILVLLAAFLSFLSAERITRSVTEPLQKARLEDLEVQSVCQELRPLASRMLDQNRQMQRKLEKQYNKLKRGYEKQDRMRRDFTANVSHELKTPLTSISGYAEIIQNGMVKEEDVSRFAGKIYDETQRLIILVGDILKLSQLEEGRQMRVERVSIDLYETCERIIATLQRVAKERGIAFFLSGEHCKIIGAEQIVDEIVYNLCDNAIKYNKQDGQIVVSVSEREGQVVLSVKDTGIGISKEEQDRVFERFYRVDQSHSKEIGGTGLGLSIVKHAALYHDAKIWLDSVYGEGTEFRISFHTGEMQ